jgi:signal transduction histidine kinase
VRRGPLSIRARLAIVGAVMVALFGLNLAIAFWSGTLRDQRLSEVHHAMHRRGLLEALQGELEIRAREAAVARHLQLTDTEAAALRARFAAITRSARSFGELAPAADRESLEHLLAHCAGLEDAWTASLEARAAPGHRSPPAAGDDEAADAARLAAARHALSELLVAEQRRAEGATRMLIDVSRLTDHVSLAIFLLSIATAVGVFLWVWTRVTSALQKLTDGTRRLGQGDFAHRIALRRQDELGDVAEAFNAMTAKVAIAMGEAREARAVAERANRAKSAFLASITHELRTPMTSIQGYAELIRDEAEAAGLAQIASDVAQVHQSSHHVLTLINDLLDLARVESGRMSLYVEDFDLGTVVDDVVRTVKPMVWANNSLLEVLAPDAIGTMTSDPVKVRQTLFNLLGNAAKFTRNGRITLSVETGNPAGSELVFVVRDTGIGIPPERLEHVFEEFEQGDGTIARTFGGTGLGLALSRQFCRMLGGEITAASDGRSGTTFTVRLPRCVAIPPIAELSLLEEQSTTEVAGVTDPATA